MCEKADNVNTFIVKIWLKIILGTFNKSLQICSQDLSVFHKTSAIDYWAVMIFNQINRWKLYHKLYKK